jgi:predicted transporter
MIKGFLRGLVGLATLPFIAGAYVFLYIAIGSLTNSFSSTIDEVWQNGLLIGAVWTVFLVFYPVITKLLDRAIA